MNDLEARYFSYDHLSSRLFSAPRDVNKAERVATGEVDRDKIMLLS